MKQKADSDGSSAWSVGWRCWAIHFAVVRMVDFVLYIFTARLLEEHHDTEGKRCGQKREEGTSGDLGPKQKRKAYL